MYKVFLLYGTLPNWQKTERAKKGLFIEMMSISYDMGWKDLGCTGSMLEK